MVLFNSIFSDQIRVVKVKSHEGPLGLVLGLVSLENTPQRQKIWHPLIYTLIGQPIRAHRYSSYTTRVTLLSLHNSHSYQV